MDSLHYSELIVKFGKNLMRIAEGAEAAADGDLEGEERDEAIKKALAKLEEYQTIVEEIRPQSKVLCAQFEAEFKFHVDLIKDSLKNLTDHR